MRKCAFCPSTKLTLEHIWGDWINKIIPPTPTTNRRKTRPDGPLKEWTTIGVDYAAKAVCAHCNNGWMSDLECNEAKPILSDMIRYGGAVSLLPRGIASIAAFAFKMTVIATCTGYQHQPYFSESERYEFARTLKVPEGVQMWLFALHTPGRLTAKVNSYLGRLPANVIQRFEMYIGTFAIGYFGVQVVATRWSNPHLSSLLGRFPGLREADIWRGVTVNLWPSDGTPVIWPPRFNIGDDYLDEFCTRWRNVSLPQSWVAES